MNGDLSAMLESVLSDPAQMEKIASMARELMGEGQNPGDGDRKPQPDKAKLHEPPGMDTGLLSALGGMFAGKQPQSRSTALLMAMRPYMRPEKQEKLDRAMKIARIVHIAGAVMKQYGGDFLGV